MADTSRKPGLINVLEKARADELAFWGGLSQSERSARGAPDRWAARDIFAHNTVGKDRLAARLEAAARDVEPEQVDDFDEANREIFEANRERSWEELLVYEGKAFARLLAAVAALTDEALADPQRFEWTRGRPLWWSVAFTAYFHPLNHLSQVYLDRGQGELARGVQVRIAETMGALDDSETWQGTILYNLACFYALEKQPGPAIENLRQALALNPGLVDWSKEDSDLDSLRELPEYQALYGS